MVIAVFDSGLGSLSIIRAIRAASECDIIYYADQINFPYGNKGEARIREIALDSIALLRERFAPDVIVMGSNTPTLAMARMPRGVIGVAPPLSRAARASRNGRIGIMATRSVVRSAALSRFIKKTVPAGTKVFRLDASPLISLAESGVFLDDQDRCTRTAARVLGPAIRAGIDVATLSSTHLPLLEHILREQFPRIKFLDPAVSVARTAIGRDVGGTKKMRAYTSADPKKLGILLRRMGLRCKVSRLC